MPHRKTLTSYHRRHPRRGCRLSRGERSNTQFNLYAEKEGEGGGDASLYGHGRTSGLAIRLEKTSERTVGKEPIIRIWEIGGGGERRKGGTWKSFTI